MKTIPASNGNFKFGRTQDITYIVIHYTANDGDTAENNGIYFQNNVVKASAHYFVDENEVVRSVEDGDTAWHCGATSYRHLKCRNANSLGVELCSRKDAEGSYYFLKQTEENAAALVRQLMETYNIPIENVLRHYDVTGKVCPAPFVENEPAWQAFLAELTQGQPSAWAKKGAAWAVERGLIQGDGCGNFNWQDPVTREALAVILHRYQNLQIH